MDVKLKDKVQSQLELLAYRDDLTPESLVENLILDFVHYESYKMFSVVLGYYKDFDYVYSMDDETLIDNYLKITTAEEYSSAE